MRKDDTRQRRRAKPARARKVARRRRPGAEPIRVALGNPSPGVAVALTQGDSTVELAADPYWNPDLLADFTRLLPDALARFVRALRDPSTALQAVAELYDLSRAACPPPRTRFDVELAAMFASFTAALFEQLGAAPPVVVRPVPDGNPEDIPPPTLAIERPANFESVLQRSGFELRGPLPLGPLAWGQRMEATDSTDPAATVIRFRVPVPIPWGTSSDLRERLTREPLALDLHEVTSLLKSTANRLNMALPSFPKSASASREERQAFVSWTSACIRQRTGRWLDSVTAALYAITFGEGITVDNVRMIRTRLRQRPRKNRTHRPKNRTPGA